MLSDTHQTGPAGATSELLATFVFCSRSASRAKLYRAVLQDSSSSRDKRPLILCPKDSSLTQLSMERRSSPCEVRSKCTTKFCPSKDARTHAHTHKNEFSSLRPTSTLRRSVFCSEEDEEGGPNSRTRLCVASVSS